MKVFLYFVILVIVLFCDYSLSLTCYRCVTPISTNTSKVSYQKAFNIPNDTETSDCLSKPELVNSTDNCTNVCLTAITNNTQGSFAIRGCADTMITSTQWSAMQTSSDKVSASCYSSAITSESLSIPATAKLCFCSTDKCNTQLYSSMNSKSSAFGKASTLTLIICIFYFSKSLFN